MKRLFGATIVLFVVSIPHALAQPNCANLPTQFNGNQFPTGDFFSNFLNSCYTIPLSLDGPTNTDLNDTVWRLVYNVDPSYQLIVVGNFPNARYFSVTAYDEHSLISQAILDNNILPLTAGFVNPFQVGVPYQSGQQYAVPINFGGTPGQEQTGCMMNAYNVGVNGLDGTQRHQALNWNTDPVFFQQTPATPLHVVDTPAHSNPTPNGYLFVRAYVDGSLSDPTTYPSVIVRDVNSGCAYPASYVQKSLNVINIYAGVNQALDQTQWQAHQNYNLYLPTYCYGNDSRSNVIWNRQREGGSGPNPFCAYFEANTEQNLPVTVANAGEVLRIRLRVPIVPPTPCTNGCSRSGNEQTRYYGLSFNSPTVTLASIPDSGFVQDANGYATLIVGTGATIPSWITPANGYTFLDLTQISGFQTLSGFDIREILPSATFSCSGQITPYKTSVFTTQGSLMGDYLPVVDFPLASTLPPAASELIGPNSCGVLPAGVPELFPNCGVLPPNPTTISPIQPPTPGQEPFEAQPSPPVTLTGAGFGLLPNGVPYTGNTSSLQITDVTQGWSAGYGNDACNLSILNWNDSRIELVANLDQASLCTVAPGDQLSVSIWNAQSGSGPVTAGVTVASDYYYALGTNSAVLPSAAGSGTVQLNATGPWTAASNVPWLQLSSGSTGGTGGALIQFSYTANTSAAAQTGTLTIAGLTFTVTQAGTSYAAVSPMTVVATGFNGPKGVALDGSGNVYVADTGNNAVEEWNITTQQLTTLVSAGLNGPVGVAVDPYGDVFIADSGNHAIEEWNVGIPQLTSIVTGLGYPNGVAVDMYGDVYFSDAIQQTIEELTATEQQVNTLAGGLNDPTGVAVDSLGNVYVVNTGNNAVDRLNSGVQPAAVVVSSGISMPSGVAVDGRGNLYFSDSGHNALKEWNAATQQVTTLVNSGLSSPAGVALDSVGNLYVADQGNNAIKKFTFAYVSLSAANLTEGSAAGSDSVIAQVLPANTPLAPTSDQPWLTITGVTGGVIAFSFQANSYTTPRAAQITVLGAVINVTQLGNTVGNLSKTAGDLQSAFSGQPFPVALEVTVTNAGGIPVEGAAVTFSVSAGANGAGGSFPSNQLMPIYTGANGTATSPVLTANNIAGQFTVVASVSGVTVNFALTNIFHALAEQSITVGSAAGKGSVFLLSAAPWTAASNAAWLFLASGSQSGTGDADVSFNYAANTGASPQVGTLTISGLTFTVIQAGNTAVAVDPVTTLVSSNLKAPRGVAVDGQGNVYIADSDDIAIKEWSPVTGVLTTLVMAGLGEPVAVALDSSGNLYIADTLHNAIEKWTPGASAVTPLVNSGISGPEGVAVDSQGDVYFSDTLHKELKEWVASTGLVKTVVTSNLASPRGLSIDALGNIYIADYSDNAIKEWTGTQLLTLVSTGLSDPYAVAVDGDGNLDIADSGQNAIKQWIPWTGQLNTLVSSGLNNPGGIAVDTSGNIYIADTNHNDLKKVVPGYLTLGSSSVTVGAQPGAASVSLQLYPSTIVPAATSDAYWLTVSSATNGAINFAVTGNYSVASRSAQISILGAVVTVTQSGDTVTTLTRSAGTGESTAPGLVFPTNLAVRATDSAGHVVSGAGVTFTVVPGTTGADGTFSLTPPMPIATGSTGVATAPVLTANNTAGTFTVNATSGAGNASFTLKIVAP